MIKKVNDKGITLIVLVVTIIILLILAGISINAVFGNEGLLKRSYESKFKAEVTQIIDAVEEHKYLQSLRGDTTPVDLDLINIPSDVKKEYISEKGKTDKLYISEFLNELVYKDNEVNDVGEEIPGTGTIFNEQEKIWLTELGIKSDEQGKRPQIKLGQGDIVLNKGIAYIEIIVEVDTMENGEITVYISENEGEIGSQINAVKNGDSYTILVSENNRYYITVKESNVKSNQEGIDIDGLRPKVKILGHELKRTSADLQIEVTPVISSENINRIYIRKDGKTWTQVNNEIRDDKNPNIYTINVTENGEYEIYVEETGIVTQSEISNKERVSGIMDAPKIISAKETPGANKRFSVIEIEVETVNNGEITNVIVDNDENFKFESLGDNKYTITVTENKTYNIKVKEEGISKLSNNKEVTVNGIISTTTSTEFNRAYGVIEIVWLDLDNNVIDKPLQITSTDLGGLTPVKWTGTAFASTTVNDTSWYNYIAQTSDNDAKTSIWANARTTNENCYFVWIPRYAYRIIYFNNATSRNNYRKGSGSYTIVGYSTRQGMIHADGKLQTGTEPSNVTLEVKTVENKDYIPHPAFEFDGSKKGIWVGKYESSGSTSAVTIKPNVASLRGNTVSQIFTASQTVKDTCGLSTGSDTHMMKNTEWGAVVYLSDSKYGRNGAEIAKNNSSSYITGNSGGSSTANSASGTSNAYNTTKGVLASTTGNIYGIYDMCGGTQEYVAGYIKNSSVSSNGYNTKLITKVGENKKYADVYKEISTDTYVVNSGMKGDAVYETSTNYNAANSWQRGYSYKPYSTSPVFIRGRILL